MTIQSMDPAAEASSLKSGLLISSQIHRVKVICTNINHMGLLLFIMLHSRFKINGNLIIKKTHLNRQISQIPQCTCPISHNTSFRTEMCTFLFWMVHDDICFILGFVRLAYCYKLIEKIFCAYVTKAVTTALLYNNGWWSNLFTYILPWRTPSLYNFLYQGPLHQFASLKCHSNKSAHSHSKWRDAKTIWVSSNHWKARVVMMPTFSSLVTLGLLSWQAQELWEMKQVSFKKEVGVMVNDLVFWLTVCLILKMCY